MFSLTSSVRTCNVDQGYADKLQSDRFLNPNNMLCPVWNGRDLAGREVSADSFMTKARGCNSALDRVVVENNVSRPQYAEYLTLSANGIKGDIYGNSMIHHNALGQEMHMDKVHNVTGQFGNQFDATNQTMCGVRPYEQAMALNAQYDRERQSLEHGYYAHDSRMNSGMM